MTLITITVKDMEFAHMNVLQDAIEMIKEQGSEEMTKEVMTANKAVAEAVRLAKPQVIPVYPITPQTTISEYLAQYVADEKIDAKYVKVESEHSAISASVGASSAGVRVFTATSSQGLMLMHEYYLQPQV